MNQRQSIPNKFIGDIVAAGIDPLYGNLFFVVCYSAQIQQLSITMVATICCAGAFKGNHLVCHAGDRSFHSGFASLTGFRDVSSRGHMGAAALEQGQFNAADLSTGSAL